MNSYHIQKSIERAREAGFNGFADGIAQFAQHNATVPLSGILPPTRVTTEIRKINSAFGEGREAVDRLADEMLRREREGESK